MKDATRADGARRLAERIHPTQPHATPSYPRDLLSRKPQALLPLRPGVSTPAQSTALVDGLRLSNTSHNAIDS